MTPSSFEKRFPRPVVKIKRGEGHDPYERETLCDRRAVLPFSPGPRFPTDTDPVFIQRPRFVLGKSPPYRGQTLHGPRTLSASSLLSLVRAENV